MLDVFPVVFPGTSARSNLHFSSECLMRRLGAMAIVVVDQKASTSRMDNARLLHIGEAAVIVGKVPR